VQLNYLVNGDLFVAGTTTGELAGWRSEQVQARASTARAWPGARVPALLLRERGQYGQTSPPLSPSRVRITGSGSLRLASQGNTFITPNFGSTTAINATAGSGNLLVTRSTVPVSSIGAAIHRDQHRQCWRHQPFQTPAP